MGSRDRDRSRERGRRRRRSRSRSPSRSRSRDRRRGRSRSRERRRRNRSRSHSRPRSGRPRSRTRSRSRSDNVKRSRSKSRSRSRDRKAATNAGTTSVAEAVQALQHQQLQRQLLTQQLLLQQQTLSQMTMLSSNKKQREIYVGNLTIGAVSEVMLRELFNGALGMLVPDPVLNPPVVGVSIDASGRFAFVEFRTEELSNHAMQLDKLELLGRPINIGRPKGYVEPAAAAVASHARLNFASMLGGAPTAASLGLTSSLPNTLPNMTLPPVGLPSANPLAAGLTTPGPVSRVSTTPTAVVLLENLLPAKDVRDDDERDSLLEEVSGECGSYGRVMATAVPKPPSNVPDDSPCRVYVKFSSSSEASSCKTTMDGRLFDGNRIKAVFIPEADFDRALAGDWLLHLGL